MNKVLDKARSAATHAAKKLTNVSVSRGQTAYPKKQKDLENIGIRWDYDGEIEYNGALYNKFQVQPNAGKVSSTIRHWREKNGGTHAVMKKGGTEEDVAAGWDNFAREFQGSNLEESSPFGGRVGGSGGFGAGAASSSSSDWTWWAGEDIWHRQIDGVGEWYAPESSVDSGWIYSQRRRKHFIRYANGAVEAELATRFWG